MAKIAIIIQRYGLEINGGAEYHARMLAEQLTVEHDVTVLTSKAKDYHSWTDAYDQEEELLNGVQVKRFSALPKNQKKFRKLRRKVLRTRLIDKLLARKNTVTEVPIATGHQFVKEQGPYCPGLLQYLKEQQSGYDVFIFFTYLYAPTVFGLPLVKDKSIFVPTAHDEPLLYTAAYRQLFDTPRYIMYNTLAERELIEKNFPNACKKQAIAGMGIQPYTLPTTQPITNQWVSGDYFVYIGRIDNDKGCGELIEYFHRLRRENLSLVLIGNNENYQSQITSENIVFTGFISEAEKYALLNNAKGLIIPSKYESLSLVTLESMLQGKLVIANSYCKVLKDHIEQSKAGLLYENYEGFAAAIEKVISLSTLDYELLAANGISYVEYNYSWPSILAKFNKAIDHIKNS